MGISFISGLMSDGYIQKTNTGLKRAVRFSLVLLVLFNQLFAQQETENARRFLKERGEVILKFPFPGYISTDQLSFQMSIDRITPDSITAYFNQLQFDRFLLHRIPFTVIDPPSLRPEFTGAKAKGGYVEGSYPGYAEYVQMMEDFAQSYPAICRLVEYGESANQRRLLALKITDQPDTYENEPALLFTSSMHGDEVTGYVLMLRLIGEILANYGQDERIDRLVNQLEIWINPLANPDGTYALSNASVGGATRFNANHIDLNRNFPDPQLGDHPDGNAWQPETMAMIQLMKEIRIVLAANFHGGAEVVNYPWDTWSRLHADDLWYRSISRLYVDSVHANSPEGYMTFMENGITNGFAWYSVHGSRQDYVNYHLSGREVTIELSDEKMPDPDELNAYWNYNKAALLGYMEHALEGISGTISDAATGMPLVAEVILPEHDRDSSQVWSSEDHGAYFRLLAPGSYTIEFRRPGYLTETAHMTLEPGEKKVLDISLEPFLEEYEIYPNPFRDILYIRIPDAGNEMKVKIFDVLGHLITSFTQHVYTAGVQQINVDDLLPGTYLIQVKYQDIPLTITGIKMPP